MAILDDKGFPLWRYKASQNKPRKTCVYCGKKGYKVNMVVAYGRYNPKYKCPGCPVAGVIGHPGK